MTENKISAADVKAARVSATDAFLSAQVFVVGTFLGTEDARQAAFTASAVAASAALRCGVTLQALSDANTKATADMVATAPKGTLYRSVASIQLHAFTGDVLTLPATTDEFDDDALPATALQTMIRKGLTVLGAKGTSGIRARVRRAVSQAAFTVDLAAAIDAAEAKATFGAGDDTGDTADDAGTADTGQTVETLLSRALAAVTSGAAVSDAARALIGELADAVAAAVAAA